MMMMSTTATTKMKKSSSSSASKQRQRHVAKSTTTTTGLVWSSIMLLLICLLGKVHTVTSSSSLLGPIMSRHPDDAFNNTNNLNALQPNDDDLMIGAYYYPCKFYVWQFLAFAALLHPRLFFESAI